MVCDKCTFLLRRYGKRVIEFLKTPPPEYMRAMGYDEDLIRFSKDCEVFKMALREACRSSSTPSALSSSS